MSRKLRAVLVEPGKNASIAEIDSTLEGMQKVVGGYIEAIFPFEEYNVALICNEEGLIKGLPMNRIIERHIIFGTFFICGVKGEDFVSLSDEQLAKYSPMFLLPLENKRAASDAGTSETARVENLHKLSTTE